MISAGEGKYTVRLESYNIGKDMLIVITGGEEDHIRFSNFDRSQRSCINYHQKRTSRPCHFRENGKHHL